MIYCNLKGGLGNMFFQIAATKSLSIDNNTNCSFPNLHHHLSYLDLENTHNPKLNHSNEYIKIFKNLKTDNVTNPQPQIIKYPFEFIETDPITQDVFIDGFFQSEKYFKHNRTHIIDFIDFSFIDKEYLFEKYPIIFQKNCTSLHIRRGDYLNFPNHHPTQSLEYYLCAVEKLKNITDMFVTFSDDIEWCKKNLNLPNSLYIENEKDYIEMYLMSLCRNNIISNSSFSWWGAWLNNNPFKKVIGPLKWFGESIHHNTGDILPENWIRF